MTKKQIHELILSGDFISAEQNLSLLCSTSEELEGMLLELAYESSNMVVYAFLAFLISQRESVDLHQIAASIMISPLCFMDGAYIVALHHIKRAMLLDPSDVSLKEMMIFFHTVPEEVVSKEEAAVYAKQILAAEPGNKVALDFIGDA